MRAAVKEHEEARTGRRTPHFAAGLHQAERVVEAPHGHERAVQFAQQADGPSSRAVDGVCDRHRPQRLLN
jgi:hypothetical protein